MIKIHVPYEDELRGFHALCTHAENFCKRKQDEMYRLIELVIHPATFVTAKTLFEQGIPSMRSPLAQYALQGTNTRAAIRPFATQLRGILTKMPQLLYNNKALGIRRNITTELDEVKQDCTDLEALTDRASLPKLMPHPANAFAPDEDAVKALAEAMRKHSKQFPTLPYEAQLRLSLQTTTTAFEQVLRQDAKRVKQYIEDGARMWGTTPEQFPLMQNAYETVTMIANTFNNVYDKRQLAEDADLWDDAS